MSVQELKPITLPAACLATLCAAFWGGLAVAIRYTQDDLPPMATAGLRFAIASLFMAAWARLGGASLALRPGDFRVVAIAGVILFVQIGTFHWGLTRTNSAHASVLIGSHPVIVALLAHFLLVGDRLTWIKLSGLTLATVGLVLVVLGDQLPGLGTLHDTGAGGGDPANLTGDAIILFSSFVLGASTVFNKHVLVRIGASKLLFWSYLLATSGFLAWSAATEPLASIRFHAASFWGLMYQSVIVAGFCFAAWTMLLRRHKASQLAVFGFGQPLFGMVFGRLFRDDPMTSSLVAGGAAIAMGILLVTRERAAPTT